MYLLVHCVMAKIEQGHIFSFLYFLFPVLCIFSSYIPRIRKEYLQYQSIPPPLLWVVLLPVGRQFVICYDYRVLSVWLHPTWPSPTDMYVGGGRIPISRASHWQEAIYHVLLKAKWERNIIYWSWTGWLSIQPSPPPPLPPSKTTTTTKRSKFGGN